MSEFSTEQQWQVMDAYFKSHVYPLTKHHIDSYREFLRNYIPSVIRTFNPITMIKLDTKGDPNLIVKVFVGGENGDAIYLDRPTMIDNNKTEVLLTPAEARLRNLTYEGHLYADVKVQYELTDRDSNHDKIQTTHFPKVLLGAIPIMVHSDACILNGQGPDVLRELGECIYDTGGYFIIDGKEKVIVSQERIANNKLFVEPMDTNIHFSHRAYIKCVGQTGESKLAARGFELYIARDKNTPPVINSSENEEEDEKSKKERMQATSTNTDFMDNAIYISFPSLRGKIPLFTLFRALGIETDKEIIETIFGTTDIPEPYIKYIRASVIAPHSKKDSCYTQADALEQLRYRVQYQIIDYVKNLLVTDIFPNVEQQNEKPMYLGYLVKHLLDVCLNIYPKTDRDAYTTKRIDISGFQLSGLFQEVYKMLSKNCRDLMDREYNLGPWRNNGNARITDLVRKDNIYKLFPPAIMTERIVKSLKGMWGSTDKDTEQGKVQDLARISFLGYLSHMRRINLPLDRSRRNVPPHRLHPQQWGFFCPFETPDGQSIGLLKNFSLLSYVTFGTEISTIQEYLSRLGMTPLYQTNGINVIHKNITKVLLNGTWYGITRDPVYHTRLLKALRRNGYMNAFVSISWNIRENTLHIQTDPGRMCRPLFVVQQNQIRIPYVIQEKRDMRDNMNWFKYLFGDGATYIDAEHKALKEIFYTEEMYYKDEFILPSWWKDPDTAAERIETIQHLEKTQGCIEFIDVDEENTLLIAMNPSDMANEEKPYTHCEIHPSAAFSVVTNTIPFANHNYAARNLFHGAQGKQTIGIYATNFRKRFDTMAYMMHYPQKPIVTTKNAHYISSNRLPNGVNAIVAIAAYTGLNQEDGIIINKSAIDRGLFHSTAFKTMTATEKVISQNERLQFKNPYIPIDELEKHGIRTDLVNILREAGFTTIQAVSKIDEKKLEFPNVKKEEMESIMDAIKKIKQMTRDYNATIRGVKPSGSYGLLDEHGIIREGAKIPRGSKAVVMGMVNIFEEHREVTRGILTEIEKVRHYSDVSYLSDVHHYGIVDKVFIGTKALGSSEQICKVRFRKNRRPELGDKFCSRHAQKGVVGMVLAEKDMPVTKDGIIPDMIINPHALPSRMTIAHLIECIFSKSCCFDGSQGDGTMFIPVDYNEIGTPLEQQGFDRYGNEIMYDGRTGRQINTEIFIGPTFYYRLKHMVSDKVHARHGNPEGLPRPDLPYDQLTKQPTEGRARNGGLRVGEMERDVILSYGMSQFAKESIMDRSDKYRYAVCRYCGVMAYPKYDRKAFLCPTCKRSDTTMIETPYAWKLLVQEFETLGIQMRYNTTDVFAEDPEESDHDKSDHEDDLSQVSESGEESESEYQHNQDLDEPALYGTEEKVMYGGMSEEIIDTENTAIIEHITDEPSSPSVSPLSLAESSQPKNENQSTIQLNEPTIPLANSGQNEVSVSMQQNKFMVSATNQTVQVDQPGQPGQSGQLGQLGQLGQSGQSGQSGQLGQSGGSMILDLDGGDADFFMDMQSVSNSQNSTTPMTRGSDIKVIEITPKVGGYYRPPSIKEDYGGEEESFNNAE